MLVLKHCYVALQWSCVHDIQDLGVTVCKDQDEDDIPPANDLLSYGDVPATPEPEVQLAASSSRPLGSSSSNSGSVGVSGEGNSGNGNLHLSVTFSPRMEITLRHSPQDEVDDGGGGSGGGEAGSSGAEGGTSRNNGSVGAVDGAGIAVGSSGGGSGGIDIQFRFTSMDVFEALEHIRERREEQRMRQDRQRPTREGSEGGSGGGGGSSSSSSSSPSGGSNGEGSWAALPRINHNMTFSLRNRRETGREGGRENTGAGRTAPTGSLDSQNAFYIRTGSGNHRAILLLRPGQNYPRYYRKVDPNHKIARNIPRLTHYIEEPNVGRGFIKELCFNADGRLICSPYAHGVRLMMFDKNCSELSTCVQEKAQILYDVSTSNCHSNCVVSTKFSPTHCLLVSGCLNGKIVWHQPVL